MEMSRSADSRCSMPCLAPKMVLPHEPTPLVCSHAMRLWICIASAWDSHTVTSSAVYLPSVQHWISRLHARIRQVILC